MADSPRGGWSAEHDALAVHAGHASWAEWIVAIEAEKGHPICGRKSSSAAPCKKRAGAPSRGGKPTGHKDEGACGDHGGRSLSGPAHPDWKHGGSAKASKYRIEGRLAETYERLELELQDAFDLTSEARIADARMVQVLEELKAGGNVTGSQLADVRDAIRSAVDAGDVPGIQAAFGALDDLVGRARRGDVSWRQWAQMADLKRKLGDTHARRQAKEHGPVHWQDLAYVIDRVKGMVSRWVPAADLPEFRQHLRTILPPSMLPIPKDETN